MRFTIPRPNYGTLATKIKHTTKAVSLHPYIRLFVFLTTFITLFSAVVLKDEALPELSSPKNGPSGYRAWKDLQFITKQPHPWNSRQNDVVREYILSEMNKGFSLLNWD
jgi:hypothetical protein